MKCEGCNREPEMLVATSVQKSGDSLFVVAKCEDCGRDDIGVYISAEVIQESTDIPTVSTPPIEAS